MRVILKTVTKPDRVNSNGYMITEKALRESISNMDESTRKSVYLGYSYDPDRIMEPVGIVEEYDLEKGEVVVDINESKLQDLGDLKGYVIGASFLAKPPLREDSEVIVFDEIEIGGFGIFRKTDAIKYID